jgi:hypothetical protein
VTCCLLGLQVLMPALERRGTISHTTHLPADSAFLLPTSSSSAARGGSGASSAKAALKSLLGYTASMTSDAAHYMSKSLTAATGGGTTSKGTKSVTGIYDALYCNICVPWYSSSSVCL